MKDHRTFCHIYGQLDQTGDRIGEELAHLFDLGLVGDASVSFEQAEGHRDLMAELLRRGGLIAPSVYPHIFDPKRQDPNWWKYSADECEQLLRMGLKRFAALSLGPLLAVTTYTPGNSFVAACRRLGIRTLLGFCAPTVGEDGGWEIAQYGAPLSPYFVAGDDFRKPENPGSRPDPLLIVNMELRSPMVCLKHHNEGPFCPLNAQAVDRWLEPGDEPLPYLAVAEDWLRLAELTGSPRFFNVNLQYFFADRCFEHNRRALEWIAEQRDRRRLQAGSVTDWARRMQAAGGFIRQLTYWRGEMMGDHVGHRPGSVADMIVDESAERQLVWQYPHALPRRFYDYRQRWDYPAFRPDGSAPASEEFPAIEVKVKFVVPPSGGPDRIPPEGGTTNGLGRRVQVLITNSGSSRHVPLALWDLLQDRAGPFRVEAPADWIASVLPHPAGTTGVVLLEGECPSGEHHVELKLSAAAIRSTTHRRRWGNLLEAQTFYHRHRPYTVLAAQTPERFVVMASVEAGQSNQTAHGERPPGLFDTPAPTGSMGDRAVRVESLCGVDYKQTTLPPTGMPLDFDNSRLVCWHRCWDVTADELVIEGVEEVEARLRRQTAELVHRLAPSIEISEPGYQLFGDVTDQSRWDRPLARAAGEAERKRIQEWFRQQRPEAGEVVIEVHAGIDLPRGSILRPLGHEFQVIRCAPGYAFRELCVDYSQGWDWGVAGWIQWRHLNVRLDGLQRDHGRYTLHLHAFDPEGRDIVQRVHAFDPEAISELTQPRLDICLAREWSLPKGLQGRWDSAALCSLPLPEQCLRWKSLGIWIAPLEKIRLYDWIAEKGAPGILCHAWLTREKP